LVRGREQRNRSAALAVGCLAVLASAWPARARAADPAAPAPAPAGGTALDVFFHGSVVGIDGAKVKLRYDFSTADQQKDFLDGVPWPIAKDAADGFGIANGQLTVHGNAGARHVADWEGDLVVTCRLIPDGVKDIGAFASTPDSSTDYATYTIGETYFHNWDKKAGGETGMMKFGKQFANNDGKGGFTGFRYLSSRMPTTPPASGRACAFGFGRRGDKLWMNVDDLKLDSNDLPPRMKTLRWGFYSIQSSMSVDEVLVEGTIAKAWLDLHRVALRTEKPVGSAAPTVEIDPAVRTVVDDFKAGKATPLKVVEVLGDASRSDADRAALVDALKTGPRKGVLTATKDLLYAADVKVRAAGIDVVKGLTGKTYGYDPKAGEKARRAAVGRLLKDLEDHPDLGNGPAQGG
jgi:hypothetical protein